jgi:hypothetical protein
LAQFTFQAIKAKSGEVWDNLVERGGLDGFYSELLTFLQSLLSQYEASFAVLSATPLDLMVSALDAILKSIMECASQIFHCTLPRTFHKAYTYSADFVKQFKSLCRPSTLGKLAQSAVFSEYAKRWQLDIFFQLRSDNACTYHAGKMKLLRILKAY